MLCLLVANSHNKACLKMPLGTVYLILTTVCKVYANKVNILYIKANQSKTVINQSKQSKKII